MLLTILVVTFNRATIVEGCLAHLIQQVRALATPCVEIVVSDNCSTDYTWDVLTRAAEAHPYVKAVATEHHLPSAEENLFSALVHCEGEYIWTFGDDDFLHADAVETVLGFIRDRPYDFYLFNSGQIGTDGEVLARRLIPMAGDTLELKMQDLACAVGLITILASFTSTVMRADLIRAVPYHEFRDISPIYSHIAAYLSAYEDRACLVINRQIITLRAGTGQAAFRTFAAATGKPYHYAWTVGFARLLTFLITRGTIEPELIVHSLECDSVGRFPTHLNLLGLYVAHLLEQTSSPTRAFGSHMPEFREIRTLLATSEPASFEVMVRIERVIEVIEVCNVARGQSPRALRTGIGKMWSDVGGHTRDRLVQMARTRIRADLEAIDATIASKMRVKSTTQLRPVAVAGPYKIFRRSIWYYATHEKAASGVNVEIIDPQDKAPWIFVDRTLAGVKSKIEHAAARRSSLVGGPS